MTVYAYSPYTFEYIDRDEDQIADWMGTTETAPPDFDSSTESCFWSEDDSAWSVKESSTDETVPDSVTMCQLRLALLAAGTLDTANTYIEALDSDTYGTIQVQWNYATTVERDGDLAAQLETGLGLDDDGMDDLFVAAGKL